MKVGVTKLSEAVTSEQPQLWIRATDFDTRIRIIYPDGIVEYADEYMVELHHGCTSRDVRSSFVHGHSLVGMSAAIRACQERDASWGYEEAIFGGYL